MILSAEAGLLGTNPPGRRHIARRRQDQGMATTGPLPTGRTAATALTMLRRLVRMYTLRQRPTEATHRRQPQRHRRPSLDMRQMHRRRTVASQRRQPPMMGRDTMS